MRPFAEKEPIDPDPPRGPRPSRLDEPLSIRPPRAAKGAEALGLKTVGDLIWHLPFRYEDRRTVTGIGFLVEGERATVVGTVTANTLRPTRKKKFYIVETTVRDETGTVKVTWFNRPWIAKELKVGDSVLLYGTFKERQFYPEEYERGVGSASRSLTPVYPVNEHVTTLKIRDTLDKYRDRIDDVIEFLPARVRSEYRLCSRADALKTLHFPENLKETVEARRRLGFEELLLWEITLLQRRSERNRQASIAFDANREMTDRWLRDGLPFEMTDDQKRACQAIDEDLESPYSMQRLLMGEVGTGKTAVALYAMLRAVDSGYQAAMIAPTETLAEQHFRTIDRMTSHDLVSVALLTGSTPAAKRREMLAALSTGELKLLVGTHALLEDPVVFDRLGLAIVDEQHRFGVKQRQRLDRKGPETKVPNMLHMTATPIPRSLALTLYGDLDVTALKERPAQRPPVTTYLISGKRERERMYQRMREEIDEGRQVFVVCPLVEESEALQAKAATQEYEDLAQGEFSGYRVALIHGQMSSVDKQAAMERFANREAEVLVATSVIEVGIDVPNATVILIEDAVRYGLSQLHQLRGRVGRGEHPSICFLAGPKSNQRLKALAEFSDGFRLSELDLELRGEGEMLGVRQSGLSGFRNASLGDVELIEEARRAATALLEADPTLEKAEHALLTQELENTYGSVA